MARVIVTGATSFIGRYILEELLSRECEVYAVMRKGRSLAEWKESLSSRAGWLHPVFLNMDEYGSMDEMVPRGTYDAMIHLAWAGTRGAARNDREMQEQNLHASMGLVGAAVRMGIPVFLQAGSQAEYGQQEGVISEDCEPLPVTWYGRCKLQFFEEVGEVFGAGGIRFFEPRIFSLYGKGDSSGTLISTAARNMLRGEDCDFSDCRQPWNFLHVRDAANGVCHLALGREAGGVYNFGSRDTRMLKEYILEMARISRTRSRLNFGALPHNDSGNAGIRPDIRKLLSTGWEPRISFEEGIREILASMAGTDVREPERH